MLTKKQLIAGENLANIDTYSEDNGATADWRLLDSEGFQQKVSELFEQYTDGTALHRGDLPDLLEDLGFDAAVLSPEAIRDAIVAELGLTNEGGAKGGGALNNGGKTKSARRASNNNSRGYGNDTPSNNNNGAGGTATTTANNVKLPSLLDLEDVTAIAMRFYNEAKHSKSRGDGDGGDGAWVVDQEVEAHHYLAHR